ncbi:MAG: hypothetical protein RLW87_04735 [Alphaproteobacteria bacterium]|jgi:hypothetical protein|uniref:hypothetical protein n=1 Tax=Pacificispira sp. TaxID=2888761 RepID=UPI0033040054
MRIPANFGIHRACAALVLLATAGCAAVPVDEFNAYRNAVTSAKSAADGVLATFAVNAGYLEKVSAAAEADESASVLLVVPRDEPVPETIELTLEQHLEVRTLVLTSIVELNDALTYLAEGKSAEQLSASLGNFGSALSSLASASGNAVPGLGAFVELGQTLFAAAEKARARQEFVNLVQGQAKAVIDAAVTVLEADVVSYHQGARAAAILRMDAINDRVLLDQANAMAPLALSLDGTSGTPEQKEKAKELVDNAKAALIEMNHQAHAIRVRAPSATAIAEEDQDVEMTFFDSKNKKKILEGSQPVTELALGQLQQFAVAIETERDKVRQIRATYDAEKSAILAYAQLLRGIRASLNALSEASKRPVDPVVLAKELSVLAIVVRGKLDAVRAAVDN